ncbi:NAD(P)/FAD-dependent oxidoreductase [Lutibaculum baratangense]|uniref:Opine oxidase subunit A n=1 Tax=Lutibaculum baratangense AMV1 TaxID=631454 RepID=V4RWL7_9HYPH|nr:NAD(P)/FAD-dependent oxidoreductase [Lutibaculum baratangense]ESR27390.1 Opine oxidase subunit A [Lutibaculum baratangense AMV1]
MRRVDLAVIGAGPAGMAAAVEARTHGLSVLVVDEQPTPGGQIWRGIEAANAARLQVLGDDYAAGLAAVRAFRDSGADYLPGALAWQIDPEGLIDVSVGGRSRRAAAGAVVVATGAVERPTPLPGWTLPGVMTVGALQILLKTSGLADDEAVLVGSGPLIWLAASQLCEAGRPPRAIVETVPCGRYLGAARHASSLFGASDYVSKGFKMMRRVRAAGVPVYRGASDVRIEGRERVSHVAFRTGRREHRLETACVALHQGVVPNPQVARLMRCAHEWSPAQRCFLPRRDRFMETSVPNFFLAGDGGGIGGAKAAALEGRIAGLRVAEKAGRATGSGYGEIERALKRDLAVRPLLEHLYAPSPEILQPADATVVCRCEEVTAGDIRHAVSLGAPGPNQLKSFLRCGMGPCQGRVCGLPVVEIVAAGRGVAHDAVGYYGIRPPLKPLTLGEIAAAADDGEELAAE